VSYCPKCHHEYAETVSTCIDCGSKLRAGNRPVDVSLGLEDTLLPIGAAICGLIALAMLCLRLGAQSGWFSESVSSFVIATQPPCMTALYAFALISCCVTVAISGIQSLLGRR
jgi:hypothetical protein